MYAMIQSDSEKKPISVFLFDTQMEAEIEIAYHENRHSKFIYSLVAARAIQSTPKKVENDSKGWLYAVICNDWDQFTVYLAETKEEAIKNRKLYNDNCSGSHTIVPVFDTRKITS